MALKKNRGNQRGNQNRKTPKSGGRKHDVVARVRFLYAAFMLIGLLIAVRIIWVQAASPAVRHNATILNDGVFRTTDIAAHRGAILTHDGEPLAISSLRYNAEIDFASEGIRQADDNIYYKNVDSLAKLLALHFDAEDAALNGYKHITAEGYRTIFSEQRASGRNRAYKLFPRLVTIDEWNTLRNYPILNGNLGFVYYARPVELRLYPLGDLARQTIGRHTTAVDENNRVIKGKGIEAIFNDKLKGTNGSIKEQWIAHGFWTRVEDAKNRLPENGCDVITTIDAGLQRVADERLREMLIAQKASFGVAIVMEVETGNILSIVSLGSGKERGVEYTERVENHAMVTKMSPGSTMKLATTMALLEIGGYTLDTKVNTEHSQKGVKVKVGKAYIEDTHDAAGKGTNGDVRLIDAFAHSSNVYFAKAIYDLYENDPAKYTSYLESIGFNDYIGAERYGEAKGYIPLANTPEWNKRGSTSSRLPRMAYGYEMELPPIHMITFYNSVANDGRMVAPRLVDRIERDGEVVERLPIVTINPQICSDHTLNLLDSCMVAASKRTGTKFKNLPTTFGCKTGTAQVWTNFTSNSTIDKQQMKNGMDAKDEYYYGSICCVMPAEKPKYTILVGVCKQSVEGSRSYYGIDLAGPVANDIMCYLYANDHSLHATIEEPAVAYSPTSIKAGNSSDVAVVSHRLGAHHTNASEGKAWSRADIDVGGNSTVIGLEFEAGTVPNVLGMGLSDALYLLESVGLEVTHSGAGKVTSQSIKAGVEIGDAETIHLTLKP